MNINYILTEIFPDGTKRKSGYQSGSDAMAMMKTIQRDIRYNNQPAREVWIKSMTGIGPNGRYF